MSVAARLAPIWAVVPVKAFDQGKSRLAGALPDAERAALARATFEHVLDVVARTDAIARVLVTTECAEVATLAASRAEVAFRPADGARLSVVIDRALAEVESRGARAAIVLMADLPWLEPREVSSLAAALADADAVLVPDERDDGSNGIALAPPTALGATAFGEPASFARHGEFARARGLRVAVARSRGLAFDVDSPDDLRRFRAPA